MERLHGAPLTDLAAIRAVTAQDPERILINALNTWFGSVLACPSFHADVHAGEPLFLSAFLSARLTLIMRSVLAFPTFHAVVHASKSSPFTSAFSSTPGVAPCLLATASCKCARRCRTKGLLALFSCRAFPSFFAQPRNSPATTAMACCKAGVVTSLPVGPQAPCSCYGTSACGPLTSACFDKGAPCFLGSASLTLYTECHVHWQGRPGYTRKMSRRRTVLFRQPAGAAGRARWVYRFRHSRACTAFHVGSGGGAAGRRGCQGLRYDGARAVHAGCHRH